MEYPIWNTYKIQEVILGVRRPRTDLKAIGSRIRSLRGDLLQEELAGYLTSAKGSCRKSKRETRLPV